MVLTGVSLCTDRAVFTASTDTIEPSTPTKILPSATAESYSFGRRRGRPVVTSSVAAVARIPNNIVSSNMITRLGQGATIGMPPVGSGHEREVIATSQ